MIAFFVAGSRLTGHLLRELARRRQKYGLVSMCTGGPGAMGAAGVFEAV